MELLARDSLRILHVEDDDDFAELSARRLKRAGFEQPIVRCHDGLRALHYFSTMEPQSAPHVILLDLHIPGMNGLEVLRWIRENYREREVAVYLLTSSENPEHRHQATQDGAAGYLLKDTLVDGLVQKLDSLIGISQSPFERRSLENGTRPPFQSE